MALFFADNGIILMQKLKKLNKVLKDCGLNITKNKRNNIIFNSNNQPEYIEDIPIITSVTYLGVNIHNNNDCYTMYREQRQQKKSK